MQSVKPFWCFSVSAILQQLNSSVEGLTVEEAGSRLLQQQKKSKLPQPWEKEIKLIASQYKNPLILLLAVAVVLSLILREYSNSLIILAVLLITGILGYIQERNAGKAVEKLRELIHAKVTLRRNGKEKETAIEEVVEGDIVVMNAGDIVPADSLIIDSKDLHVNESALTGESFPVEKFAGSCNEDHSLSKVTNAVFKGTSVINGTATILAVKTGKDTELGKIATTLLKEAPLTAFEKGIQKFGYMLMRLTIIISGIILIFNLSLHKPIIDSVLFALALAVGLAPELLPAIVTITLSAGAKRMAGKKVIVKKLSAIQNLGEIDILCSDKTGTITEGIVQIDKSLNAEGVENPKILQYAFLNAFFETGFSNPIDEAIRNMHGFGPGNFEKCDEVPYDFIRKRLSVVVSADKREMMITKGSVLNILQVCTSYENTNGTVYPITTVASSITSLFEQLSAEGQRVIGVCYKDVTGDPVINKDDESGMTFLGFVILTDPPKKGIAESIKQLRSTGIELKIITGDNELVAKHIAMVVGLPGTAVLTGGNLHNITDEALVRKVRNTTVFAEIIPAQKERIVKALQKSGLVVGYLGDGINDANALQAADVGISIDNAVDVAKEAADLVLLDRDIDVIREGIIEGRKTFINTLKYIFVTTSANFGNMLSMAIASLMLPFLPLLPVQILLNNFLSDLPAITIASDNVDHELVEKPRKWDMRYIKRFMFVFGLQSSIFDFATFAVLLFLFRVGENEFRTAWFMESLLTEVLILLVIRTKRPFFNSRPSGYLLSSTIVTFLACLLIPYLPFTSVFGLFPLPFKLFAVIILIIVGYVTMSEVTKRFLMNKL